MVDRPRPPLRSPRTSIEVSRSLDLLREALKECRAETGYSLRQVAGYVGCSPASIYGWENGRSFPPLPEFLFLCSLYGTTPDEILGR